MALADEESQPFNPEADLTEEIVKFQKCSPENISDEQIRELIIAKQGDEAEIQAVITTWWDSAAKDEASHLAPPEPPALDPQLPSLPHEGDADAAAASPRGHHHRKPSHDSDRSATSKSPARSRSPARNTEASPPRGKPPKKSKKKRDAPKRVLSSRGQSSQVRLLAEHCFTLSDEAVNSLVRYRIPSQSRWDFKQKIHVRDETIKHLQRALDLLNQEKQRFKTACVDIENNLQEDLSDVKAQLAVALATGGSGSPASAAAAQSQGEDNAALRQDLAELRATTKSKDRDLEDAISKRRDLENKVSELNEQLMRSHFEKREGEADKTRAAEEVIRLSQELANSRKALEMKNKELSLALASFSEHQRNAETREKEMRDLTSGNDTKLMSLEKEKTTLMEQISDLKAKAATGDSELGSLKESHRVIKEELDVIKAEHGTMKAERGKVEESLAIERGLKERAQKMEEEERRERIAACAQLLAIQQHHEAQLKNHQGASAKELEDAQAKIKDMEVIIEDQKRQISEDAKKGAELEGELGSLKHQLQGANTNIEELQSLAKASGEVELLKQTIKEMEKDHGHGKDSYERRISELEGRLHEEEQKVFQMEGERRKLQNTIQELRGNVRVFARLRPFLPNDKRGPDEESAITVNVDGLSMSIVDPNKEGQQRKEHKFTFDKAFAAHQGQEEVFQEVSEFVQSALDGFNVTLFSYGQTGSGKTHTMQGSGNREMRGIIPRAIEQVGIQKRRLEEQGWVFDMKVSFVEIYNEVLKDLLNEDGRDQSLRILRDAYGMTEIEDVTIVDVEPEDKMQVDNIMDVAAKHRSVAATDMNAQSSRSHSIFTLHLVARNEEQHALLRGQLNLCDLAGSERVDRSGAQGKALTEAKNINKSLSTLTSVFNAINSKSQHVPFRDSKLTYLLQPSFSGDGKTLMMINLSPTELSYFESLSTLRFGAMVNSCELGRATRKLNDIDADAKKMRGGGAEDKSPAKSRPRADRSPARTSTPAGGRSRSPKR